MEEDRQTASESRADYKTGDEREDERGRLRRCNRRGGAGGTTTYWTWTSVQVWRRSKIWLCCTYTKWIFNKKTTSQQFIGEHFYTGARSGSSRRCERPLECVPHRTAAEKKRGV